MRIIPKLISGVESVRTEFVYRFHRPQRVLFDHLPKCAGSTINQYLSAHYPRRLIFETDPQQPRQSVEEFRSLPSSSRLRYELIVGHQAHDLLDLVHPDTIAVTIFRDPIDRIVSHYYYVRQNKHHYLHDRVMQSRIKLEGYASSQLSEELQNWYTTHFSGLSIEEVDSNPEEALRLASEVISNRYTVIGFQEDLSAVGQGIEDAASLCRPFVNKVENKTRERSAVGEISERARDVIAEMNAVDVKLYALLKSQQGQRDSQGATANGFANQDSTTVVPLSRAG